MLIRIHRRKLAKKEDNSSPCRWEYVYGIEAGPKYVGPIEFASLTEAISLAHELASKMNPHPKILCIWKPDRLSVRTGHA